MESEIQNGIMIGMIMIALVIFGFFSFKAISLPDKDKESNEEN